MTTQRVPPGLAGAGRALWRQISAAHDLDAVQEVLLVEACRTKDRLDRLDAIMRGDAGELATLSSGHRLTLGESVAREANATADALKKLLAGMRLPDPRTGRRPGRRPPRGVYRPRLM